MPTDIHMQAVMPSILLHRIAPKGEIGDLTKQSTKRVRVADCSDVPETTKRIKISHSRDDAGSVDVGRCDSPFSAALAPQQNAASKPRKRVIFAATHDIIPPYEPWTSILTPIPSVKPLRTVPQYKINEHIIAPYKSPRKVRSRDRERRAKHRRTMRNMRNLAVVKVCVQRIIALEESLGPQVMAERRLLQAHSRSNRGPDSGQAVLALRVKALNEKQPRLLNSAGLARVKQERIEQDERPRKVMFENAVVVREFDIKEQILSEKKDSEQKGTKEQGGGHVDDGFVEYIIDDDDELVRVERSDASSSSATISTSPSSDTVVDSSVASDDTNPHTWYHSEYKEGIKLQSYHCRSSTRRATCECTHASVESGFECPTKPFGMMTMRDVHETVVLMNDMRAKRMAAPVKDDRTEEQKERYARLEEEVARNWKARKAQVKEEIARNEAILKAREMQWKQKQQGRH